LYQTYGDSLLQSLSPGQIFSEIFPAPSCQQNIDVWHPTAFDAVSSREAAPEWSALKGTVQGMPAHKVFRGPEEVYFCRAMKEILQNRV
jgi:hypothetical protein